MPNEIQLQDYRSGDNILRRKWLSPLGMEFAHINRAERELVEDVMVYRNLDLWQNFGRGRTHGENRVPLLEKEKAQDYYEHLYTEMLMEMMRGGYDPRELFVGNPKSLNILDFGCGNGQRTRRLVNDNSVWGVDISSRLVAEARNSGINASVANVDDQELPFPKETFNLVYAFDVFEHLFKPEHALDELRKAMKNMGLLIVTVPVLKDSTMDDNVAFHKQTLQSIGRTDDPLANIEPEVGVRSFIDWVKFFSKNGFRPITRAFGYSWDRGLTEKQRINLFMNPTKAGDVCFVLSPRLWMLPTTSFTEQMDVEVAAGALSEHEFFTESRIFPSEQAAALSMMSNM